MKVKKYLAFLFKKLISKIKIINIKTINFKTNQR